MPYSTQLEYAHEDKSRVHLTRISATAEKMPPTSGDFESWTDRFAHSILLRFMIFLKPSLTLVLVCSTLLDTLQSTQESGMINKIYKALLWSTALFENITEIC